MFQKVAFPLLRHILFVFTGSILLCGSSLQKQAIEKNNIEVMLLDFLKLTNRNHVDRMLLPAEYNEMSAGVDPESISI